MIRFGVLLAASLILSGCSHQPEILGSVPDSTNVCSVAAARQLPPNTMVLLSGTMTEKCPAAGCWFILRDPTGTIKVETKNAGFVVMDVSLQTGMTVAGRVLSNAGECVIEATGLRY